MTNQTQKAELERLTRTLDSARRREEELETELRESGQEAESMARGRDQALLDATRLEQEKEALQAQLDSQRREQRQREREAARLRQQLESTSSALEHSSQRACSLEAEHRFVCTSYSMRLSLERGRSVVLPWFILPTLCLTYHPAVQQPEGLQPGGCAQVCLWSAKVHLDCIYWLVCTFKVLIKVLDPHKAVVC